MKSIRKKIEVEKLENREKKTQLRGNKTITYNFNFYGTEVAPMKNLKNGCNTRSN